VTKHGGTNRTRDESNRKGGERLQRCGGRVTLREEDMRENDNRGGGIDIEIEELGGANQ
jgi:hypothetical protein